MKNVLRQCNPLPKYHVLKGAVDICSFTVRLLPQGGPQLSQFPGAAQLDAAPQPQQAQQAQQAGSGAFALDPAQLQAQHAQMQAQMAALAQKVPLPDQACWGSCRVADPINLQGLQYAGAGGRAGVEGAVACFGLLGFKLGFIDP